MYYWICPECGAHLDTGERCDCKERAKRADNRKGLERCLKKKERAAVAR